MIQKLKKPHQGNFGKVIFHSNEAKIVKKHICHEILFLSEVVIE